MTNIIFIKSSNMCVEFDYGFFVQLIFCFPYKAHDFLL